MHKTSVRAAQLPADLADVQRLCWAYRDHLWSWSDKMRDLTEVFYPTEVYASLLNDLPQIYSRPGCGIVLAERDGAPVGCGMYHSFAAEDAEIKRLFISPEGRGAGLGEAVTLALIASARADGYRRILLDTNAEFTAARRLYEKLGFRECASYGDMDADVAAVLVFYELSL